MNIDLESMSREELEKLRADVDKALKTVEQRRKVEARKAAEAKAREMGFTLEELIGGNSPGSSRKPKSPAKYRNPEDPTKTWTGRGRQPAWIKEGLAAGKSLDDFSI
jgi:DNA-binding protein H-NS